MESTNYYSLIQFSPDRSKHEAVNIGVAVYSRSEHRVYVRISKDNRRIKRFFGDQDWQFVAIARRAIQQRLSSESFGSVKDLEEFISRRANSIRMTELQPISSSNVESDVEGLYSDLVEEAIHSKRARIDREFGQVLLGAGVRGLVKGRVRVPLSSFGGSLQAPYAFQNGRFNLLEPVQFGADGKSLLEVVGGKAIEGRYLYEHPDPTHGELCLNVVGHFSPNATVSARNFAEDVFAENNVRFYSWDDLEPLFREIRDAARLHENDV